jgi:hypothetical protein
MSVDAAVVSAHTSDTANEPPLARLTKLLNSGRFASRSLLSGPPPPLPFGPHDDTPIDIPLPSLPLPEPLREEVVDAAIDKCCNAARGSTIQLPSFRTPFVKDRHKIADHIARVTVETVSRRTTPYPVKKKKTARSKPCPTCKQTSPGLVLTLNNTGQLRQMCWSCSYWSHDEYCITHELKLERNEKEGHYNCPADGCKFLGIVKFTPTKTLEDYDKPMTAEQEKKVMSLYREEKCKSCSSRYLDTDPTAGMITCMDCGVVQTRVLIVEDAEEGAVDRQFEEDLAREHERSARLMRAFRTHDAGVSETERILRHTAMIMKDNRESVADRLAGDITRTWLSSTSPLPLNKQVIAEAAALLALYSRVMKEKLPRCSRSAVQHAAAIFVVTRNQPSLCNIFSGLSLCEHFMPTIKNTKGQPASITVRTSMFTQFTNRFYAMGEHLPKQYEPPTGPSGRMLAQFWLWAQVVLREASVDARYPLTVYDIERINTLFTDVMKNKRQVAETHQFRTIAAVVYCKAVEGTEKRVDGKRVRMSLALAAKIMQVSKATLSDMKPVFFPVAQKSH